MTSKKTMPTLTRERLLRDKFALLAKVGHNKRKASAYQDEAEFYFTTATESLAILGELLDFLQSLEKKDSRLAPFVAKHTSKQHHLIRTLLSYWPKNSDSQERLLTLLDSDGLVTMLDTTPDGYSTLSTDLILENVARCIAATSEESNQKP